MFCSKCGNEINDEAVVCVKCGCLVNNKKVVTKEESIPERSWVITYILAWFLGVFGAHRFFTGYIGIGIAQVLTFGGCGIWALVDFICLSFNCYKDPENKELPGYIQPLGIAGFCICMFGTTVYILLSILMSMVD